jgi:hypothetical protein
VLGGPRVVEVVRAFADARVGAEVEGEQARRRATRPGLCERTERALRVIVKAAHAPIGPVVVVEGAVLLHEEDDMLDGAEV